jgi:magnesium-protoporphyrin IX monomethyl ester (oxidative) cyclase
MKDRQKTKLESVQEIKQKTRPKILLIQPPMTLLENEIPSVTFPLGIAYIAAYIEKKGYDVSVIDCVVLDQTKKPVYNNKNKKSDKMHFGLAWEELEKKIRVICPDVVGVSCLFSSQSENSHRVAKIVKKIGKIPVVFGGAHPSSLPWDVLKDKNVDAIVIGEGEETFYQYLQNMSDPEKLYKLDGFAFRIKNKVIVNKKNNFFEDLDKLPFPARHLFPMNLYFSAKYGHGVDMMRSPITSMITSRGCPYNCVFCSIHTVWGKAYRARSTKNVVDEIELLVKDYGVREIHFEDDNLTLNKGRMIEICKEIIKRKIDIRWTTPNGVALWTLDRNVLSYMKRAGCYKLCFGIESGDLETQKFIRKGVPLDRAKKIIRDANDLGIWTHGFFIIGFPFENRDSIENSFKYAIKTDLDFASFFLAAPYPETELYRIMRNHKMIRNITWTSLRVSAPTIKTKYFTIRELVEIQKKLFVRFVIYRALTLLNPRKLWYRLKRFKNIDTFRFIFRFIARFLQIIR